MQTLMLLLSLAAPPPLPPGAVALNEPGRYRLARSYDDTLEFYRKTLPRESVRWTGIVNSASVKADHIELLARDTPWSGINIYETKGEVRIYFIKR